MKNLIKWSSIAFLSALTLVGCSSEDEVNDTIGTTDPIDPVTGEAIATINLTEGTADTDIFYALATGEAGETVPGRVIFTTAGGTQRRLYVTQTLPGGSSESEVFVVDGLTNKELKADGSIDLDGEAKEGFDFTFNLNVPSSVTDGSIIYNFWSTNGKGDFRDPENSFLIGVGTIEVEVGTGVNPDSSLITYSNIRLEAPAADGSSSSFFSLFNGQIYTIDQGTEFAAFWDLGYFHLNGTGANLASPVVYNENVVNVPEVSSTPVEELNNTYFSLNTSGVDFDSMSISSDLDNLTVSTLSPQEIDNLQVGDVIEFLDNYNNKGLIRITEIEPGFSPTEDYITFDIKVQAYSAIDTSDL